MTFVTTADICLRGRAGKMMERKPVQVQINCNAARFKALLRLL